MKLDDLSRRPLTKIANGGHDRLPEGARRPPLPEALPMDLHGSRRPERPAVSGPGPQQAPRGRRPQERRQPRLLAALRLRRALPRGRRRPRPHALGAPRRPGRAVKGGPRRPRQRPD